MSIIKLVKKCISLDIRDHGVTAVGPIEVLTDDIKMHQILKDNGVENYKLEGSIVQEKSGKLESLYTIIQPVETIITAQELRSN
jgi:hypothetical protein